MSSTFRPVRSQLSDGSARSWSSVDLAWLLGVALLLRLLTYHGLFGSDDLNYLGRAVDVATWTWSSADYNGSLRYGFNIPAGLFIAMFGATPFVANIWPFLCSLVEVATVYVVATSMLSRRAGVYAGVLLATTPLHIAVATRVHVDPVVSMFITLSFALLWFGVVRRSAIFLLGAGLAIGSIFWAKELAAVVWIAYLPMLWLFRRDYRGALTVVGGVLIMLVLHGLLMTAIAGDPLHLVKTVLGQLQTNFIEAGKGEDAAGYYLQYLFLDIRHTGLLCFLALGSWLALRGKRDAAVSKDGYVFVVTWCLGLLLVLSVFPVSISPLRFVMKQSNYITLFIAPVAILAAFFLVSLPSSLGRFLLACTVILGGLLGFLQQADYRSFTANSKGLAGWVIENPGALIIASTNNRKLAPRWAELERPGEPRATVLSFRDLSETPDRYRSLASSSTKTYALLDKQTMHWGAGALTITAPRDCWQAVGRVAPLGLGVGNHLAAWLARVAGTLRDWGVPGGDQARKRLQVLATPQPADLYRVVGGDVLCGQ